MDTLKQLFSNFSFESHEITETLYRVLLNSDLKVTELASTVALLLEKGADLHLRMEKTGKTALHVAIESEKSSVELIKLILEHVIFFCK